MIPTFSEKENIMDDFNDSVSTPADSDTAAAFSSEAEVTLSDKGLNFSASEKGEVSITDRVRATFSDSVSADFSASGPDFKISEEASLQNRITDTLTRTTTNKSDLNISSSRLRIAETLSDSYNFNDILTYTDKSSASMELNADGFEGNIGTEQSVDFTPGDYYSENITYRNNVKLKNESVGYESSVSTSTRVGSEKNNVNHSSKYGYSLSSDKGAAFSGEESVGLKTEGFEANSSIKGSVDFDGEKTKRTVETNNSAKIGDEKNNVELYNKHSVSRDSEGEKSRSNTNGMNINTENFEAGTSHTNTVKETDNSVEESNKTENTVGVKMGEGVKLKNTTTHESSEKASVSKDALTYESSDSMKSKTRIEVDSNKVGAPTVIASKVFNAGMAFSESLTDSESKSKTVIPLEQEQPKQEQDAQQLPQGADASLQGAVEDQNYSYGY